VAADPIQAKAQAILSKMSLDDKIAQMMMVQFSNTDYVSSGLQQMVAQHVGGVLYQQGNHNFDYPNNTIDSVHAYSAQINADDGKIAPLIAVDEEGGLVDKIGEFFSTTPSAEQLAQSGDTKQAYKQAANYAPELKQLGINVDLAPVVDVGPNTTQYGSRFFSADPAIVATYAGAFIKGLQDNGIPGTLKHFPGLGSSDPVDPHDGLPTVSKSLSDLQQSDFLPYQKIIQQDNPAMVMTTDVLTQALDSNTAADISPKVIDYLRHTLHFNGVIVTDDINMGGLYQGLNGANPSDDQLIPVGIQAIEAGNDLIEAPRNIAQVQGIIKGVEADIQKGTLSQSQIDQSVTRILMMKIKYGIIK
jgi:beta-N-acetylhexosaminidase